VSIRFDLPQDVVFAVDEAVIRLNPAPHPLAASRAEIDANWERETARQPALFNGEVALLSRLVLHGRRLEGTCHIVDYATFLYWRSLRPTEQGGHAYAHAMLVTTDGALVAIRMGSETVNPGVVYFAAGSFEPVDFRDGIADPEFNMQREVEEETGLDISGLSREPVFHALSKATGTVLFKRYFLPFDAAEAERRIRAHVATQERPEIEGPVVIRNARDVPSRLAQQMPALIEWHFGGSRQ
jgi:8-oxo-dGTP pyrophosphatase MutT (NUDIX family)